MRTCSKCGLEKSLEDFYRKSGGLHGRETRCKKCQRGRRRGAVRERLLQYKYGISEDQYKAMHDEQHGLCRSCGLPETRRNTENLAVDHDHKTGKVRALLCQKCNTVLGLLDDDPEKIKSLLEYIQQYP